MSSAQRRSVFI